MRDASSKQTTPFAKSMKGISTMLKKKRRGYNSAIFPEDVLHP
jgi:hypothetical protein